MRIIALSILTYALFPATAAAQTWTPEQQEVWATVEQMALAFNRGEVEKAYEGVHPDFVFWNSRNAVPGNRQEAWTLDSAFWGTVGARMHGATVTPLTIKVFDDVAAVHAYIRGYQAIGDGEAEFATFRWTSVWRKEDGRWLQVLNYVHPDQ